MAGSDGDGGPNGAQLLKDFADRFKRIKVAAGDPSLRDLEHFSRTLGKPYSRTTFSDKLNGKHMPSWEFAEIFVEACARFAKRPVEQAEVAELREAHRTLTRQLAEIRNKHREQLRGTAKATAELAVPPSAAEWGINCDEYLRRLRTRYRMLDDRTNALARRADGAAPLLLLSDVFEPQSVRAREPEIELPREVRRRLVTHGRLTERDTPEGLDRRRLARELADYASSPRRAVLEVLAEADNRRTVLLGDPGTGKSTLATYVMLALADLAGGDSPDGDARPLARLAGHLPLLIELRSCAPRIKALLEEKGERVAGTSFLHEIESPGKPGHPGLASTMLKPYLDRGGQALVIFDGLDEVFDPELRERVKWEIFYFAREYSGVRAVVTSRPTDYEPEFRLFPDHGFRQFTLQELDSNQVARLVRRFYRATLPDIPARADELADYLLGAVRDSAAIEELSGNPMLLTALILLGRGVPVPRKRGTVLKHMVEVLVHRWDAAKSLEKYRAQLPGGSEIAQLDADYKQELLRLVARRILAGEPGAGGLAGNYLSGPDLIAVFSAAELPDPQEQTPTPAQERSAKIFAKALVNQLRKRDYILAKFGDDEIGFVHRALLDYLAADDINAQVNSQAIKHPEIPEFFRQRSAAPEWREVLSLLSGMLPPEFAGEAVKALLHARPLWYQGKDPLPRHVLLAFRCLGEIQRVVKVASASRAAADALIAMLETLHEPADYPFAPDLTQALERDVLPVLSGLGPDWAGRPTRPGSSPGASSSAGTPPGSPRSRPRGSTRPCSAATMRPRPGCGPWPRRAARCRCAVPPWKRSAGAGATSRISLSCWRPRRLPTRTGTCAARRCGP